MTWVVEQASQYSIHHCYTNLQNAVGIYVKSVELLPSLHEAANKYHAAYQLLPNSKKNIELLNKDILEIDFSDANIIYIPSTLFKYDFLKKVAKKCSKLKEGTTIITLKNPMPCITEDDTNVIFDTYKKEEHLMTWGRELVIYQTKL